MNHETEQLADLMSLRRARMADLVYLCQRQLEMIDTGDMAPLFKVLSAKQRLLGELQALERSLDPFREQRPEDRVWQSDALRAQCARDCDESNRALGEVFQLEQRSSQRMIERRDAAATGLAELRDQHEACGAYLAPPADIPYRQLDLSSDA